jgi:hypothetical protein
MSDKTIEVTQDAVNILAEALDDVITMARATKPDDWFDSVEELARQSLSLIGQAGWVLECQYEQQPSKDTGRERNLLSPEVFQAVAHKGQADVQSK